MPKYDFDTLTFTPCDLLFSSYQRRTTRCNHPKGTESASVGMPTPVSDLFSNEEAAAYIGLSPRTLNKWRVTGKSPTVTKVGRKVFYRHRHLDEYLDGQQS